MASAPINPPATPAPTTPTATKVPTGTTENSQTSVAIFKQDDLKDPTLFKLNQAFSQLFAKVGGIFGASGNVNLRSNITTNTITLNTGSTIPTDPSAVLTKGAADQLYGPAALRTSLIQGAYQGNISEPIAQFGGGGAELVIGFVINSGATGTDVGPILSAPHSGTISTCKVTVKQSDGAINLTFNIQRNGADIFAVDPTVAAGTAPFSLLTFPVSVIASQDDLFSINITSGSASWVFVAQLET
jgi:hypothetical protein